jgi:hypothetical protein
MLHLLLQLLTQFIHGKEKYSVYGSLQLMTHSNMLLLVQQNITLAASQAIQTLCQKLKI